MQSSLPRTAVSGERSLPPTKLAAALNLHRKHVPTLFSYEMTRYNRSKFRRCFELQIFPAIPVCTLQTHCLGKQFEEGCDVLAYLCCQLYAY